MFIAMPLYIVDPKSIDYRDFSRHRLCKFTTISPFIEDTPKTRQYADVLYPKLRNNNRASNRANRVQTDHDIMEGLPVRQWKQQPAVISTAPPKDTRAELAKMGRWVELDMPKGSDMYSPWCHALLRAARRGQIKTPHSRTVEEEKEMQDEDEADNPTEEGYMASKWSQLPKDSDQPEPEFLAKRRKGLPSLYGTGAAVSGPMRKTKVKRVDAEGHVSIYEVLAPEGTRVEGEVLEDTELPAEVAVPGTVVEGVGVVNAEGVIVATEPVAPTPPRRRPPPPKRKPKGPGRGRKKKVVIESAGRPTGIPVDSSTTMPSNGPVDTDPQASFGVPTAEAADKNKLKEASVGNEGDEGSDEEDEEGEEVEDPDREEGEIPEVTTADNSPSKPPPATIPSSSSTSLAPPRPEVPIDRDASSSPDVPLAALPTPLKTQRSPPNASPPPTIAEASASGPSMASKAPLVASANPFADIGTPEAAPSLAAPADPAPEAARPTAAMPTAAVERNESIGENFAVHKDATISPPSFDPPAQVTIPEQPENFPPTSDATSTMLPPTLSPAITGSSDSVPKVLDATASAEPLAVAPAPATVPAATPTHFENQPSAIQVEAAPPAEPTSISGIQALPPGPAQDEKMEDVEPVTVANPPATEPKLETVKADIPEDHNLLAGLAAPQEAPAPEISGASEPKKDTETSADGEEDLFGSLERHLNKGQQESK